jgi:hypothetical protein
MGTIMFADAVFEVASESTIATPVKSTVRATLVCDGSHAVIPGQGVGEPGRNASPIEATAVEQDDAQSILAA